MAEAYNVLELIGTFEGAVLASTTQNRDVFRYTLVGVEEDRATWLAGPPGIRVSPNPGCGRFLVECPGVLLQSAGLLVTDAAGRKATRLEARSRGREACCLWDARDLAGRGVLHRARVVLRRRTGQGGGPVAGVTPGRIRRRQSDRPMA